jgi:HK97 family phage prohead protease
MQHKLIDLDQIEVKFDDARRGFFSGYASMFNGVDSYGDTVIPGAYKATLEMRKRPVQMRWNHFGEVIGKWLDIRETDKGLWVEGELTPGHSKAEDVYASLKHGAVSGLSIGYRVNKGFPNETGGMDLHEIDLVEISVVESPADLAAQIGDIKSAIDELKTIRDIERFVRESGFAKENAVMLVNRMKSVVRGELEQEMQKANEIAQMIHQMSKSLTK